ncbi:non-hydrolyzing UDP-N-acetylglucosamine 2-epimerase [uncultured Kiloniella sp.]|uniref:non-hydrolyzing UDP-N-acetylglucosamine 2-epimerase n=1 Tax=uncultured Kiloniella sp. TaxID=1133091 RepID=UPI0026361FFC|nr:UDP-N-acetylglucosamine 2-epimerase (non-hydrolyzing) [uncultured Kiloniella sp.]
MSAVFVIFGTRPEAIKLAPVVWALKSALGEDAVRVVSTAQHREMLDQVLDLFGIKPDYDLNLMRANQSLNGLCADLLKGLNDIFLKEWPARVVVQGDTTTCFAGALAAFHMGIPVDHVEAGLRTGDLLAPFPEEMNRRFCDLVSSECYAATEKAAAALRAENVDEQKIHVTGNTVIDALLQMRNNLRANTEVTKELDEKFSFLNQNKKLILVTGHRRESFGEGIRGICRALVEISEQRSDVEIFYPVHLNPNVRTAVEEVIGQHTDRIFLGEPLDYQSFVYLMDRSYLILSDSGGIQEEAPALDRPLLVLREKSERMEAMEAGVAKLVGTETKTIVREVVTLLDDVCLYKEMVHAINPFGDGRAAQRIAAIIKSKL